MGKLLFLNLLNQRMEHMTSFLSIIHSIGHKKSIRLGSCFHHTTFPVPLSPKHEWNRTVVWWIFIIDWENDLFFFLCKTSSCDHDLFYPEKQLETELGHRRVKRYSQQNKVLEWILKKKKRKIMSKYAAQKRLHGGEQKPWKLNGVYKINPNKHKQNSSRFKISPCNSVQH